MSRDREGGLERVADPLMDSPIGEQNYFPDGVREVCWNGDRILRVDDFLPEGEGAKLSGKQVWVYISPNNKPGLDAWLLRNVIISGEQPGAKKLERMRIALDAGLPAFLAVHYGFGYEGNLEFGDRYKGAKHVVVMGLPESGKTPLVRGLASRVEESEEWSLETKYDNSMSESSAGEFEELSVLSHHDKQDQKQLETDLRLFASELLDKKLREFAEKSKLHGRVSVCIWDTPGLPRLLEEEGPRFARPTDPLDLIVSMGGWDVPIFLSRPLVYLENDEMNHEVEKRRLEWAMDILRGKGLRIWDVKDEKAGDAKVGRTE